MKHFLILSLLSIIGLYAATPAVTIPVTIPTQAQSTIPPQQDKELAWVDEQIQAILPARIGISDSYINSLSDPMKLTKAVNKGSLGSGIVSSLLPPPRLGGGTMTTVITPPKPIEEPLRLQALINKSALISGKWYKQSDSIRNFTLGEVRQNSVLLIGKNDQKLILFLTKPNNNIQIKTK